MKLREHWPFAPLLKAFQKASPGNYWGPLAPLCEALNFLTLVPIPGLPPPNKESLRRFIPWFPVAGLLIGTVLLPFGVLAGLIWGASLRATLMVIGLIILTSGLHLDGLADTFDGVLSWRPREQKLEIMRDSRIGVMGGLALVAVIILKVGYLQAVGEGWWRALLLATMGGRWAMLYGLLSCPSARASGLGHSFQAQTQRKDLLLPTIFTVTFAILLGQMQGLIAVLLVWTSSYLLTRWWSRDLGGLTGDTYGALCELNEVVILAVMAARS